QLRQDRRPPDGVDQPAPFMQWNERLRFQPQHGGRERQHCASGKRDERDLFGVEQRGAADLRVLQKQRAKQRDRRNDECRREQPAGQEVTPFQRDHRAGFRFSRRSNSSNRTAWIANARSAVGIAHTESAKGCTCTPLSSMKPLISRMEPMAMNTSSPKNSAML